MCFAAFHLFRYPNIECDIMPDTSSGCFLRHKSAAYVACSCTEFLDCQVAIGLDYFGHGH